MISTDLSLKRKSFSFFVSILLILFYHQSFSQTKSLLDESRPLTPSAFQYLKYTDMPIGKYTGVADISVPLYQIEEDGVHLPITLSYHSAGVRVSEEASEVGLGWSMQMGSIVQIVNDLDDLDPSFTKSLPDYIGSTIPTELPYRWEWPVESYGSGPTLPVNPPLPNYAFPIATGRYYPINGHYDIQSFLTAANYDSEPDIFKANFFGHSVNFVLDWKNGYQIAVINQLGYTVKYLNDGSFAITVPSGEIYTFALKNAASSLVYSTIKIAGGQYGGGGYLNPGNSSATWVLTGITTKNKHEIAINYTKTAAVSAFPQLSQTWKRVKETGVSIYYGSMNFLAFMSNLPDTNAEGMLTSNRSEQTESHIILSSIVFSNGRVDFYTSDRSDILGGKKIDNIRVSSQETVRNINLNYTYSDAQNVGGGGFVYDTGVFGSTVFLRLKLASVTDGTGGTYTFNYDPTQLPAKNSFAQDQWGFYNGNLANSSLIPNPVQYLKPELGDNGNNHSASLPYTRAEVLTQIVYPTGGSANFEYELNTFDNYWVPDYDTNTNTASKGCGLRIKSVIHRNEVGTTYQKHVYVYSGGKALLPINLYRNFTSNHVSAIENGGNANAQVRSYFSEEFNGNGYYSPASLSSVNGIGYDQVTDRLVDDQGTDLGYTVTDFHNYPNTLPSNSVQFMSKVAISVPALENRNLAKTGLEKNVKIYDQQGTLKKKVTKEYRNLSTPFHYALRVSDYQNYYYTYTETPSNTKVWGAQPQHLVAIYPIYDFISNPYNVREVEYFETDSLTKSSIFNFNTYNLPQTVVTDYKGMRETARYEYISDHPLDPLYSTIIADGRIADPVSVSLETSYPAISNNGVSGSTSTSYGYRMEGGNFVRDFESHYIGSIPDTKTFDKYDNKGNLLQFTEKGKTTSLIWSYNQNYIVGTVENATYSTIENILGAGNLASFATAMPTTYYGINNFLAPLQNDSRVKNSLIGSYSYRPLIGMSTVTDSKGMTTFYEYDGFLRLKAIKDQDGNIVKQFDYHYKQP
ncbi:hypothetical protein [Pedobacter sp. SG908]|uniref:hypothetical protein n=1 Tax=Pedobacter sp. SG908 TaxID=2587135 RepID=UPI00141E696D|nr:hypothetical protein [Pedobacter sp. SG908]NII83713.1 YD repeat-containing protein [Pedobacter sp. SG908]